MTLALAFVWVFCLATVLLGAWAGMDVGDMVAIGFIGICALVLAIWAEDGRKE